MMQFLQVWKQEHQHQLRMLRNENFESISIEGIYPTGEGAGFAGGIISAAVDGIKVARKYRNIEKYNIKLIYFKLSLKLHMI